MEYSVRLSRLPEQVRFPERLRGRINYEAAKGLLSYQGFMTKCTYDELAALDDDAEYHRALEELFVLTSQDVAPPPNARRISAIVLAPVAAMLVAAAILWAMMRLASATPPSSATAAAASTAP
jgi:hypothetical protein